MKGLDSTESFQTVLFSSDLEQTESGAGYLPQTVANIINDFLM